MTTASRRHFTLALLMAAVAVIAVGLGAMRAASPLIAQAAFTGASFTLLVGILGSRVRRGEPGWAGFSLFGWGYMLFAFVPHIAAYAPGLITASLLDSFAVTLHPDVGPPPPRPAFSAALLSKYSDPSVLDVPRNFPPNDPDLAALSPADLALMAPYHARITAHLNAVALMEVRRSSAPPIGHCFLALAFGLIGAFLGRTLAPSTPAA